MFSHAKPKVLLCIKADVTPLIVLHNLRMNVRGKSGVDRIQMCAPTHLRRLGPCRKVGGQPASDDSIFGNFDIREPERFKFFGKHLCEHALSRRARHSFCTRFALGCNGCVAHKALEQFICTINHRVLTSAGGPAHFFCRNNNPLLSSKASSNPPMVCLGIKGSRS